MTLIVVTTVALIATCVMFAFSIADKAGGTFASGVVSSILWSIVVIFAIAHTAPWSILLGTLNAAISILNATTAVKRG